MKPHHAAANNPHIMTTIEIAEYLKFHPSTIYRLIRKGKIPCFKIGSDYRFDVRAIDKWMINGPKVTPYGGARDGGRRL